MFLRLLLAAFLLAHGLIHASFLSRRPPDTPGAPEWAFDLGHSWLLSPLRLQPRLLRILGLALIAATVAGFALGAIATVGLLPTSVWPAAVSVGGVASVALLLLFFRLWLMLGIIIDAVILWAALVAGWTPERLSM
ncbi:MAG TPA: hypothetical protein VGB34_09065 [Candidatus Limnocylindria bacterium]|jgi:hypothetical protein